MTSLYLIYGANVMVISWLSFYTLVKPQAAVEVIFSSTFSDVNSIRLIGFLWTAIGILSFLGMMFPLAMSPVLLLQLIYKSMWFVLEAIPKAFRSERYPKAMAMFFVMWVIVLPWIIPWGHIFGRSIPI